ncbi:hypothetical protein CCH79_00000528 [Gambusia affinis]|uniref:Protein max n=1 Tax=Gambusia affinis TaxID=33528 RepID=A0A315VVZ8_GAMAF|nr:hypothetical protein CCH79_00000528 [Gambusia affinis]
MEASADLQEKERTARRLLKLPWPLDLLMSWQQLTEEMSGRITEISLCVLELHRVDVKQRCDAVQQSSLCRCERDGQLDTRCPPLPTLHCCQAEGPADKRAHHNALERKRRDHIKDSFHSLRDSVPSLQGEKQSTKQASRAQILDKATEYIQYMRRKNHTHQQDIDDLKRQNALLEQQVRALEKVKGSTQIQTSYSSPDSSLYTNPKGSAVSAFDGGSDSSSESEAEELPTRKKLRMEAS